MFRPNRSRFINFKRVFRGRECKIRIFSGQKCFFDTFLPKRRKNVFLHTFTATTTLVGKLGRNFWEYSTEGRKFERKERFVRRKKIYKKDPTKYFFADIKKQFYRGNSGSTFANSSYVVFFTEHGRA